MVLWLNSTARLLRVHAVLLLLHVVALHLALPLGLHHVLLVLLLLHLLLHVLLLLHHMLLLVVMLLLLLWPHRAGPMLLLLLLLVRILHVVGPSRLSMLLRTIQTRVMLLLLLLLGVLLLKVGLLLQHARLTIATKIWFSIRWFRLFLGRRRIRLSFDLDLDSDAAIALF